MLVKTLYYVLLTALLCAAAVTDIRRRTIPDLIPLLLLAAGAGRTAADVIMGNNAAQTIFSALGGALLAAVLMLVPAMKGKLGGGDVKLSGAAGIGIGLPYILHFLFISLTLAAVYGLIRKAGARRSGGSEAFKTLPLAPFMLCGAAVMLILSAVNLFLQY